MHIDCDCEQKNVMEFASSTLTAALKLKAQEELGEEEEKTEERITNFIKLINGVKNLNSQQDQIFLLKFLRTKKYNYDGALSCLLQFYRHRKDYPHLHKFDLEVLKVVMDADILNFSSLRTKSGCAIWMGRLGKWNPKVFSSDEMFLLGNVCMQIALDNPVTQVCGVVVILDFSDYGWRQQFQFTPDRVYAYISSIQGALPHRIKEVHIINHPKIFQILFAMVKPILNQKLKKRIFFHGFCLESLHKYVPPEVLPEEFGGTLGPFRNDDFYNTVIRSSENFLNQRKFGFL